MRKNIYSNVNSHILYFDLPFKILSTHVFKRNRYALYIKTWHFYMEILRYSSKIWVDKHKIKRKTLKKELY